MSENRFGDAGQFPSGFLVRFGQRGQRIKREQEFLGFFARYIKEFHYDFEVGIDLCAEVAVDELNAAIGKPVADEAAGEADLIKGIGKSRALAGRMASEVMWMRNQIAGLDRDMTDDAIANRRFFHHNEPFFW